jgi:hypothetical protein
MKHKEYNTYNSDFCFIFKTHRAVINHAKEQILTQQFVDAFARVRKAAVSLVMPDCPTVLECGTTIFPLEGLLLTLYL